MGVPKILPYSYYSSPTRVGYFLALSLILMTMNTFIMYLHKFKFMILLSNKCISLPGVATTMCTPLKESGMKQIENK